jgi:PAS domain S-box-containing protein
MGVIPASAARAPAQRPDASVVIASTTAEMLAALPDGLMLAEGASPAERRISDILALYRAVFLNSTDPIAIVDSEGRYLELNTAHQTLLGYSPEDLRGQTPAVHLGDETFAAIVADLQRNGLSNREVLSRTKDGRSRVIDLSAFAVRDRAGRPVCYVGIIHDITDERRAAAELTRRFEELQVLYRMADSLAQARALKEIYDEAIDGLCQALGADRASIRLFDDDGVMRFKAWRGLSDSYRAAVEGRAPWERTTRSPQPITIADIATDPTMSELLPVLTVEHIAALAFFPLVDDTRTLLGMCVLYFDDPRVWTNAELQLAQTIARHVSFAIGRHRHVTQLRASAAEQDRLLQQAHEANRAKSLFLATMSHELRTPLNAIAGYADLLEAGVHGEMTRPQREAVERVQANQRHLLRLIDDLLDFAKLEAGHLQFEIVDVPVQETIDGTRVLIEPQLRAKNIAFDHTPGDALATCRADRAKMQQVLANLLSNAWKFTPAGGTVSLSWATTAEAVRVHVSDTGPGIASEDLDAIFQPFVQLHTGFRRKVEGTGLGLAISRELARGMGGDVSATSVVGQGATFTLTLPRSHRSSN